MGNCSNCIRSTSTTTSTDPKERSISHLSKQELISNFEADLPFSSMSIDKFEQLFLKVVKVVDKNSKNGSYEQSLQHNPC